jgi:hypothetical protein
MIGITTRTYRGFAILIECVDEASPPFRAMIRHRFRQAHPSPRVFKGDSEEDVVSQAMAQVERVLAESNDARQTHRPDKPGGLSSAGRFVDKRTSEH